VDLARKISDPKTRAALLDLAVRWTAKPPSDEAQRRLDGALQEFNARQMLPADGNEQTDEAGC
jgi:hypothetical protein